MKFYEYWKKSDRKLGLFDTDARFSVTETTWIILLQMHQPLQAAQYLLRLNHPLIPAVIC